MRDSNVETSVSVGPISLRVAIERERERSSARDDSKGLTIIMKIRRRKSVYI